MTGPDPDVAVDDTVDAAPAPPTALELRRPSVPATLDNLGARGTAVALEIMAARETVMATARKGGLRLTSPEDHVLFKSPAEQGGQITSYVGDGACQKLRDLFGIEIFNVSPPQKIPGNAPGEFHYLITADGRCKLTGQTVERIEGGRSSTDDFCRGKTGVELELLVRKAARANLDGNIVRELAGLANVPLRDLDEAWAGTTKSTDACRRGRGFGTRDARLGGDVALDAGVDPPICRLCKKPMELKRGQRGPFYSCPNRNAHGKDAYTVDGPTWVAEQKAKPATSSAPAQPAPPPVARVERELKADEIFENHRGTREPGQEG